MRRPVIDSAARNPHAVAVGAILLGLVGLVTAMGLPLQLRPTVEPPEITVTTTYPGSAPAEVEDQVTRRIEEQVRGVSGLDEMVSTSSSGRSEIILRFADGIDRDAAMVDVMNKMAAVRGLPPEVDPPEIQALSSDQQNPMMWFGVRAPEGFPPTPVPVLRRAVDEQLAPRLRRVDGVAGLVLPGGQEREMHVVLDPGAIADRGLSVPGVLGALAGDNRNTRGGPLRSGKREYQVRTLARADDAEDLGDIVLRRDASGSVRLRDVATVREGEGVDVSLMRQDGIPAVAIGVQRRTGANVPATADAVRAAVAEVQEQFRLSGVPVQARELYSETSYIDEALEQAAGNIAAGAVLALGVLWGVLRSWRAVGLVALAQPLAVAVVFPVLWLLDRTLNIITLAGVAFGVGLTIDSAIVVVENIFRHREQGKPPLTAALEGTREVGGAMLAATVANVCVFAPVVILGGEAGQIFRDLAIAISAAAVGSLVAVLTIVPAACARWLGPVPARAEGSAGWLGQAYGRIVDGVTGASAAPRVAALVGAVGLGLAGALLVPDASYLPEGNRNLVLAFARQLPGTSADAAADLLRPVESELVADPRVQRTFVVFSSRFSALGVVLRPEFADAESFTAFLGELRGRVAQVPGFRFLFPRRATIFQNPGKQFELTISGPDLDVLAGLATAAQGTLSSVPGILSVRSNYETGTPELQVLPDRRRLAEVGASTRDLALTVEAAVGGRRVGTFLDGGQELDLVAIGPEPMRRERAALSALPVAPGVRLDAVASVVDGVGPVSIAHYDQERAITLSVSVSEDVALQRAIHAGMDALGPARAGLDPGYAMTTTGSADRLGQALAELGRSFAWAVAIVYLLLVALYRSWGQPLVILAAVPLAVCGALVALVVANLFARVDFDTIAMLGLVLLCGVVVNTSILVVSQAQVNAEAGMAPRAALRDAAVSRLRPILVSAGTSVIGMLPLAAGRGSGTELYRGLGVVTVGGLVLSTLLVPLVVPALMAWAPYWRRESATWKEEE